MLALCLVSRVFQRAAEPRLYARVRLVDASSAAHFGRTLFESPRHALLIRHLSFYPDQNRFGQSGIVPASLWVAMQNILKKNSSTLRA